MFLISCLAVTELIPPDFEEKLCVTAIIISGREQNKIIIERSFQNEYPSEVKEYLEDLSVMIKSEDEILFEYFNPETKTRTDTIYLPDNLIFTPNQKYILTASSKNIESIISEIVVPDPPSVPELRIEGTVQTLLPFPFECHNPVKSYILNIKFKAEKDSYYYFDITRTLNREFMDYNVVESNSPYLETIISGFKNPELRDCHRTGFVRLLKDYRVCFFDGKTVPDTECNIKIKIDLNDKYYNDYSKPVSINLNSVPADLYTYEKSYHIYRESYSDPFSEPAYLAGNIKGGNGFFAICSSYQYSLVLPD